MESDKEEFDLVIAPERIKTIKKFLNDRKLMWSRI